LTAKAEGPQGTLTTVRLRLYIPENNNEKLAREKKNMGLPIQKGKVAI